MWIWMGCDFLLDSPAEVAPMELTLEPYLSPGHGSEMTTWAPTAAYRVAGLPRGYDVHIQTKEHPERPQTWQILWSKRALWEGAYASPEEALAEVRRRLAK